MLSRGWNLSVFKVYYKTSLKTLSIGANTFEFFPKKPNDVKARKEEIECLKRD